MGGAAALAGAATLNPKKGFTAPEKMTMAAVGDCILSRKISKHKDPRFKDLVEILRRADCTWGNCEMVYFDGRKGYPAPKAQDMNLICEPWGPDELAWLGIDFMGIANNHSMDYGINGLLSTMENLERVHIGYAGAGIDLEEASRPRYIDTPGGRIGQVNCAASFPTWSTASYSHPYVNGRPGLNPLTFIRSQYLFEEKLFNEVWKLSNKHREALGRSPMKTIPKSGRISFLGARISRAETTSIKRTIKEEDKERIINAIKIAKRNSRLVIASIHSHEGYGSSKNPNQFLIPFARACIDAGADVFFGTGPHVLWGIEMHNGKPIFYSLGNFIFQYETVKQIPPETLEALKVDYNSVDPSLFTDRYPFPKNHLFWESVVPYITFEKNKIIDIKLHPVVLGHKELRYQRGTPLLAKEEEGKTIIEHLAKLSKPFGTNLEFSSGVGRVLI
jgi:poly-gamma-glutamate synthesis protein (capsule biosynthesis protein)